MAELIAILRPHWEAHQDEEGTPLSVESRARQIAKDLRQRDLTASMEGMNLDDRGSSTAFSQQLAAALVELLDNVMISIVETENRSKEAVEGLLELTAAVATDDVEACGTVLARAVELSETQVDHVRCAAGKTIGWITKYITKQHKVSEYNDILDTASQALLPLFTDKTQPTRLAAIRAGVHFFQKDATDPEVLQSLLWSCQHDPSVSNRVAAVESVPITLETIDFLVQRVRDVKSKVRVASLQALRNKCNDFSILESYHCVTIVQAGYTER